MAEASKPPSLDAAARKRLLLAKPTTTYRARPEDLRGGIIDWTPAKVTIVPDTESGYQGDGEVWNTDG